MLSDQDRQSIVSRYAERFQQHGLDLKTLNPGAPERYQSQHGVHASVADLQHRTLLDVGCGLANFYQFLHDRGVSVDYIGYDIVAEFIESDKARFPEACFEVRDIFREGIAHQADYVVMCQVFNNRYDSSDNYEIVKSAIALSFEAARKGVSIDLKSTYVNYQENHLFYYSPETLFSYAKTLTPFVTLRHDYAPFDFTLQLYKERTAP